MKALGRVVWDSLFNTFLNHFFFLFGNRILFSLSFRAEELCWYVFFSLSFLFFLTFGVYVQPFGS